MIKFDDPSTWPRTWRERCELISEEMQFKDKRTGEIKTLTPMEIFYSNPHGELMFVHDWFIQSAVVREVRTRVEDGEDPVLVDADMSRRLKVQPFFAGEVA